MKTIIHCNGSKWAGEKPDTIEKLIEVLKNNTIEERFFFWLNKPYLKKGQKPYFCTPISESTSEFYKDEKGMKIFFGNFEEVSHVFRIATDDKGLIKKLTQAIKENKGWSKYHDEALKNKPKN